MIENNAIKESWNAPAGMLELFCGHAAFDRILERIRAEAPLDGVDLTGIRSHNIYKMPLPQIDQRRAHFRDRMALLGCSVVGALLAFVFATGLHAMWVSL